MTAEERLKICESCPLVKMDDVYGPTCDSSKWMNPMTGETSRIPKTGWIKGCGCRLRWRSKNLEAHCVAKKW